MPVVNYQKIERAMNKDIYGTLNINKPPGLTSHDVVERVRKLLKTRKVGHTGTLDRAAGGVLPICVGKATRLSQYLLEADKEYHLIAKLGETTDTQDASGRLLEVRDWQGVTQQAILQVMQRFMGEIEQIPPMYSACKHNGKRLYKLAREGKWVERKPRRVIIYRLELAATELPLITLESSCSKGTYMRTLCADLGEALGCGAHLYKLVRIRSGKFTLDQAISLDELKDIIEEGRLGESLFTLDQMLAHLPAITVDGESARRVALGSPVLAGGILNYPQEPIGRGTKVRIYSPQGRLLAIAESGLELNQQTLKEGYKGVLWPKRVVV